MRLMLLGMLFYACGDDTDFVSTATKKPEKREVKKTAVESLPEPEETNKPKPRTNCKLNTGSELCPPTCGEFFSNKNVAIKNSWIEKYKYQGQEYQDVLDDLAFCSRNKASCLDRQNIIANKDAYLKRWNDNLIELNKLEDRPQAACKFYYSQRAMLQEIKAFYESNCSLPCD